MVKGIFAFADQGITGYTESKDKKFGCKLPVP